MSDDDPDALTALAGAVLDGEPIDWASARAATPPDAQPLVDRLRALERIAEACRPEVFGRWAGLRLLERIGAGAFGEVYRAWDPRLDRHVALKLLPAEPEATTLDEGRRLARVRHPNVVTIHGAERIGDRIGLWMEFVDGRTLHDLVVTDGRRFTALEAAAIGRTLCAAVGAVHDAGLLHRDITARNVMVTGEGRVVLMDFGSGRDRAAARIDLAGTPLYLAPEVLRGVAPPSIRSDVYSIGVLLYFLFTGRYPVSGTTVDDLREQHARGNRRPWPSTGAPTAFRRAVESALDPRPGRRPNGAPALAAQLDAGSTRPHVASAGLAAAVVVAALFAAAVGWLIAGRPQSGDARAAASSAVAVARQEAFRQAWTLAEHEGAPGPRQAAARFAELIAADPTFAPAHAGLVLAHAYLSMNPYQGLTFAQTQATMRAAALEALRLDPGLAEGHVALGWVHAREFEWSEAERAFRQALRIAPALTAAYTGLAISTLQPLGRLAEAEQLLRDAGHLDPLAPGLALTLGRVLLYAGRPYEAIAVLEPVEPGRRTDANFLLVDVFLGRALMQAGRAAEALLLLERRRQRLVNPDATPDPWAAWAYVALGHRGQAEALAAANDRLPFRRAIINGALGRTDRMFDGLDAMLEQEPQRLAQLLRAPELIRYRSNPRFRRLVARLRLDDAPW